jgi:hypothetical protein
MSKPLLVGLASVLALAPAIELDAQSAVGNVNVAARRHQDVQRAVRLNMVQKQTDSAKAARAEADKPPTAARRHPYVGAQVGYAFGDGDFASNAVASGTLMYSVIASEENDAKKYRFFLPVVGNFGSLAAVLSEDDKDKLGKLASTSGGLRIALEPYYLLPEPSPGIHPAIFASAGWVLRTAKDTGDTTRYLPQGRLVAGLSIGLGPKNGAAHPIVLELAGVHSAYANREFKKVLGPNAKSTQGSFLATLIVPVAQNTGFLTEVVSLRDSRPVWRMGFIFVNGGTS